MLSRVIGDITSGIIGLLLLIGLCVGVFGIVSDLWRGLTGAGHREVRDEIRALREELRAERERTE